jgi:hypothetical protein
MLNPSNSVCFFIHVIMSACLINKCIVSLVLIVQCPSWFFVGPYILLLSFQTLFNCCPCMSLSTQVSQPDVTTSLIRLLQVCILELLVSNLLDIIFFICIK